MRHNTDREEGVKQGFQREQQQGTYKAICPRAVHINFCQDCTGLNLKPTLRVSHKVHEMRIFRLVKQKSRNWIWVTWWILSCIFSNFQWPLLNLYDVKEMSFNKWRNPSQYLPWEAAEFSTFTRHFHSFLWVPTSCDYICQQMNEQNITYQYHWEEKCIGPPTLIIPEINERQPNYMKTRNE